MKKLFLLGLVALGVACTKPTEELPQVEEVFKIESVSVERNTAGKGVELIVTINGQEQRSAEVVNESFSGASFAIENGTVTIHFNEDLSGYVVVQLDGVVYPVINFPASIVTPEVTDTWEDGSPKSGNLYIVGKSYEGIDLDLQLVITN